MKTGHVAGLVLGLVLSALPAHANEPKSIRDAMARAQQDAQRKGTSNLLERLQTSPKRSFERDEPTAAPPLPDFKTRSMPDVHNQAPAARK